MEGQASAWSEAAFWELGLTSGEQWRGQWIALEEEKHVVPGPATHLRKGFVTKGGIARARLYVTARGVYIPFVNGQRVGEDRLTPGWTDYNIRIRYQTYDVTALLASGANAGGHDHGAGLSLRHAADR